ncbi:MAG TPA: hypothetical protein VNL71_06380 [Chloroflexota bacterium]|nr:hypothetical protein [Chloroflexota bacterium]
MPAQTIERDYVLTHLCAEVGVLHDSRLIFKGGTLLRLPHRPSRPPLPLRRARLSRPFVVQAPRHLLRVPRVVERRQPARRRTTPTVPQ